MNGVWIWKRVDRLLRPENNPDGRDVIELEPKTCDECDDKWIMNAEYELNDVWLWELIVYWDQKTLQMRGMW